MNPRWRGAARALIRALQQELALGKRLAALSNAQTEALVSNDVARVSALEAEGRVLVEQQTTLGQQRVEAARALASAVQLDAPPDKPVPSLAQIVLRLPLPEARQLIALRGEILRVEQEIQAVNARNRVLLQNALEFVEVSLYALTQLALRPARYGTNPDALAAPTFYVDQRC